MKPSIPKGTRDFGPAEMQKRQLFFNIVKAYFHYLLCPYRNAEYGKYYTLTGKYGEEAIN